MAIITTTSKAVLGSFSSPKTVLTAADTFTYIPTATQELVMFNTTGSNIIVNIKGAAGVAIAIPKSGGATFAVNAGISITVPANDFQFLLLPTIDAYLQGVVSVTNGVGVVATIIQ
jgi:hypothetical protein